MDETFRSNTCSFVIVQIIHEETPSHVSHSVVSFLKCKEHGEEAHVFGHVCDMWNGPLHGGRVVRQCNYRSEDLCGCIYLSWNRGSTIWFDWMWLKTCIQLPQITYDALRQKRWTQNLLVCISKASQLQNLPSRCSIIILSSSVCAERFRKLVYVTVDIVKEGRVSFENPRVFDKARLVTVTRGKLKQLIIIHQLVAKVSHINDECKFLAFCTIQIMFFVIQEVFHYTIYWVK